MALGLSVSIANSFLDWLYNGTAMPTAPAGTWIQLHTAAPGPTGVTAVAGNGVRKDLRFALAQAEGGAITNSTALAWTAGEVDTTEQYTHWTAWSASAGGTFLCSGALTANAVSVGDEFVIPIADFDSFFATAS